MRGAGSFRGNFLATLTGPPESRADDGEGEGEGEVRVRVRVRVVSKQRVGAQTKQQMDRGCERVPVVWRKRESKQNK